MSLTIGGRVYRGLLMRGRVIHTWCCMVGSRREHCGARLFRLRLFWGSFGMSVVPQQEQRHCGERLICLRMGV
ncbi:hypothetical protein [uncultured Gordonia sp.]|uniref:hypothetical protein n=1 Tax=uncultured Gordonia sp. TaxID=198437 RepID=UPI0025882365|nr:hypothetical protein [uncultured Gordonia sp.]